MQHKLNPRLVDELRRVAVVPVLTIDRLETALPLAQALVRGGLTILEITLRTPVALEAMRQMAENIPGALIGAGTVLTPEQGQDAIDAGARFLVSPGMTPSLLEAAQGWNVPFLPGAATASEAMALSDLGYRVVKFFPAEPAGGVPALKAFGAPLADIMFCPTGGIDLAKAPSYLALPNVVTVGGSWIAPAKAIAAGEWHTIEGLAREAAMLRTAR